MFRKNREPVSLLRSWTTRYLFTLVIGLLLIGILSTIWIRHIATQKQLDMTQLFAEEVADRIVNDKGQLEIGPSLSKLLDRRQRFMGLDRNLALFILDPKEQVLFAKSNIFSSSFLKEISLHLESESSIEKIDMIHLEPLYVVKKRLDDEGAMLGWIILLVPEKDITGSPEELQLLAIMLTSLGFLGWGVIYVHSRKLAAPIKNVAAAAKQIVDGNYDVDFNKTYREREMHELVESFKEMADRLRQLESIRTELLAGVTHELKTPVTSISGLVQAVKDEIVTGEESREFLEICLKETTRLEKMVGDLLDFNSFSVGAITVHKEMQNLNQLIQEIAYQWTIVQETDTALLQTRIPEERYVANTDSVRVQQVLINMLNNAKQAAHVDGHIELQLYATDADYRIDVVDHGTGIPVEEQSLIFERFFRGSNKKEKVRGLGLGLTFSKMMARALGGDLVLKESSSAGSTFTFILPK
ncbi:MAG: ATP-binding protein [Clostridia bacterium]